tara:strand:- start:1659 stop:6554 length:4896 start_codon:yes stop_codon:yes gene_type:complete
MPLSRLDNFLKNVKGNIIYVDPNNLDATDGIENQGNSFARPFKTLQRALVESARFSYQKGIDNDRFEKTTIYLAPGTHHIDNRPGWIPIGANSFRLRNGLTSSDFPAFSSTSNFDIFDGNNALYKLNSIHGGVIIPRGTSLVGQDLRKCVIRPIYVPNPENELIERSAIFRVTGTTYMNSFTIKDADNQKACYKDYSSNTFKPTFSHHRLTVFEYADGRNNVNINDDFITYATNRTDLDMYYEKVGLVYGPASGREIEPDFPSPGVDIQPRIDEFRIVGPTQGSAGISSIKAGNGIVPTSVIDVQLATPIFGLNIDTEVIINNVTDDRYNGTFNVTEVTATTETGVTGFKYEVPVSPGDALPNPSGTTVNLSTDTVTSASPYIFNCSIRSLFGMCGMHADGSKADGFKSMVVAQFTGVGLQIDDNAFVKYNTSSGAFDDSLTVPNLHTDIDAVYKPAYNNFHIKASNNSLIQLVSIFAIGYSNQFLVESGADFSLTNSNSNFGQIALVAKGYKDNVFSQDDAGYITQIIPPRTLKPENATIEFSSLDITKTTSVGDTSKLYLYNFTNQDEAPNSIIQGYRFGAKNDEDINVVIPVGGTPTTFRAKVVMDDTAYATNKAIGKKVSRVGRNVSTGNSITSSTLTFTSTHQFIQGETVRIISNDGRLPDGLDSNKVYFSIVDGLGGNQIQIAQSLNDALSGNNVTINNLGDTLIVESRVSDKLAGDIGHPIQFDTTNSQWYVNVSSASTENNLYAKLIGGGIGDASPRSFFTRLKDSRQSDDRIHKVRYVIPSSTGSDSARTPLDGYIIQESGDVTGANNTEVALEFNPGSVTLSNDSQMRNFSFIANVDYRAGLAHYTTEKPHRLSIGSSIEIGNVTSTLFPVAGVGQSGFNGVYEVTGITSARTFSINQIHSSPGTFTNNTSSRTTSLPFMKRKNYSRDYYVYDVETINDFKNGEQDGIYYLSLLSADVKPTVAPFNNDYAFSQPVQNLYPQLDRDNPKSTATSAACHAPAKLVGETVINNPLDSITGETLEDLLDETGIGVGITDIVSNSVGTAYTIFTDHDHGLNRITKPAIDNPGAGYGDGSSSIQYFYNATLENTGAGSIGRHGTALVTVDGTSSGEIIDIAIMDGGSAFVAGDTFRVVGIATTTGFSAATGTVNKTYNNLNDVITIAGINQFDGRAFNSDYKITSVPAVNEVEVVPLAPTSPGVTAGLGNAVASPGAFTIVGPAFDTSSFVYNKNVGLATVTTDFANNFRVNNSVTVSGASQSFFNGSFICVDKIGLTTVVLDVGINTVSPSTSGTIQLHSNGLQNNAGDIVVGNGKLHGREQPIYAGITTTLSAAISNKTTDTINVNNMTEFGFLIGDYVQVNDEIMRIKTTVSRVGGTTQLKVFRAVYGTIAAIHPVGSVIQRIRAYPIEFRRNSIIRASGHTFEYVGFGPGNYSTAFPDKQTKELSTEQQIISQAQKMSGGVVNYTGMNDRGDFYIGNKRIASITGREQLFNTPVQTVTGEDPFASGASDDVNNFNYSESSVIKIDRNLVVNGGDKTNILSEFNGPVQFTQKVVSTSPEGLEASSLFIQGNAQVSRKITVGIATPSEAGNPGDIVYNANPTSGGTVGWVYTTSNAWKTFGTISS